MQDALIVIKMISEKCPYCDKEVEAYTEKHLTYLLDQHILAKHPEHVQVNYNG